MLTGWRALCRLTNGTETYFCDDGPPPVISFDLKCGHGHSFEGWFADSATFAAQTTARDLTCPLCGDADITKALMTPNFVAGRSQRRAPSPAETERAEPVAARADQATAPAVATVPGRDETAQLLGKLAELREQVEKNCDYVGNRFADEARKIHYGETEQHNIYGETTPEDADELREEGIEFGVLPWPTQKPS